MSALSNINFPEIDLSKLKRPNLDVPDAITNLELPKFDMPRFDIPSVNVGEAVGQLATAVGLKPRSQSRSRVPIAVGGLIVAGIAGVIGFVVMTNHAIRARVVSAFDAVRERIATMRSGGGEESVETDTPESIAFPANELNPIAAAPYTNGAPLETATYSTEEASPPA